jgi:hypothetical protein
VKTPKRRIRENGLLSNTAESLLTACAVVLLIACIGGITTMLGTLHIGLRVGDILVFKPEAHVADGLAVKATHEATFSPLSGDSCILDPAVMAHSGGSIVIERQLVPESGYDVQSTYEVHWAGLHTSTGNADCGPYANLALSQMDLQMLVNAIGGFSFIGRSYLL